ncbi:MAG: sulfide/dihydroorotate dehydrogenase-like FAD/NAD-binding protein [candidate division Zixibacteria bacterium]|nr:sulfide/dihydroorotate dehydrogenase-like FAD/NAD-binding protein [candidate division Zixibacteria bacterium]
MNRIVYKQMLTPTTALLQVEAPWIARKAQPGQFIIVRLDDEGERIPLSLSGWDRAAGTLRLIVQGVGFTTKQMIALEVGDSIRDVVGPLGQRTHLPPDGTLVVIGGGYGAGAVLPTAREARAAGRRTVGIIGARTRKLVLMEEEMRQVCNEVFVTTDDGSQGIKGLVTDALSQVIAADRIGAVLAVGPVPMMRAVSELTRPHQIPTFVSLNAIMVDGTGMCGGCRVTVGGQSKFACFDGPDFDGHTVNYDELIQRQKMYKPQEAMAQDHECRLRTDVPMSPV